MAGFNQLDKFTDEIVKKHNAFAIILNSADRDPTYKMQCLAKQSILLDVLYEYYETLNGIPKFRGQKGHCKKALFELNPGMFRGYFKTDHL